MLRFIFAVLCLAVLGCGETPTPSLSISSNVEWTATQNLRIGSLDDPASALTRVGGLAIDHEGRIYVSQPMDETIRVFDAEGQPVATIGRAGDGPGEFREVRGIGIFSDTLYVSDPTAARVTFFSLTGQVLETLHLTPHGLSPEWFAVTPWWLAPDGTALSPAAFLPPTTGPDQDSRQLLVRIDRAGEVLDTAVIVDWPSEESIELRSPVGSAVITQPFAGSFWPIVAADGSRVAVTRVLDTEGGDSSAFCATVLRSLRDTVWSNSYSYEPIPISASMVDSTVAARARRLNKEVFPNPDDAERQIRQGISVPDHLAPMSGGVFAEDGQLWLQREDIPGEDQRWTVLDTAGIPVAQINLPRGLRVEVVRSDTLWGVEVDAFEVPYVVRYLITR